MEGLALGLANGALYVLFAAIIVAIIIYGLAYFGVSLPPLIVKLLWAVVVVIAIIVLLQLLFGMGMPRLRA